MNDDDDDVACGMLARARMSHATCLNVGGWLPLPSRINVWTER